MAEGSKAIGSFADTKAQVAKASAQVDNTQAALNQLSSSSDLKRAFKNYSDQVKELDMTAKDTRKTADAMREKTKEYVAKWEEEMDKMNDPSIRASLASRREAVRANFEQIRTASQGARDAYQPYMAKLQEIQKALSIDLSPSAVPGLKPAIDAANVQGRTLKARLADVQAGLDRIQAGLGAAK